MDAVRVTVRVRVNVIRSSALTLVLHLFNIIPPRVSVRVSASYSTYSVLHLFSIIPPRGSVRVQQ